MAIFKLTKTSIDRLETNPDKQELHRDTELKGFGLRTNPSGSKTFFVEKRIAGKVKRITIGRFGELTAEQARKEAQHLLGEIATGHDPAAEKRKDEARTVTLNQVFKDYLESRKDLKPKTIKDYRHVMNNALACWRYKPLLFITKDKVERQHRKIGTDNGPAYANMAMRVLRALFNFAISKYEDTQGNSLIHDNPVNRLSKTKAWYRVDRRKSVIKPYQFPDWFNAVNALLNHTIRDYLLLMLFTGLRRNEGAALQWQHIDFQDRTLTIHDPKNHEDHIMPLSDYLMELLQHRQLTAISDFVFPGDGASGHLEEPRKQMARITESTGVEFMIHDLRRTFITTAESLDIPAYAVKHLCNHKTSGDVTAGYIIKDVERLRKSMQKITDYILKCAHIKGQNTVVSINDAVKQEQAG